MSNSLHFFSLSPAWKGFLFYYDTAGRLSAKGDLHIWKQRGDWPYDFRLQNELKSQRLLLQDRSAVTIAVFYLRSWLPEPSVLLFWEVPWPAVPSLLTHCDPHLAAMLLQDTLSSRQEPGAMMSLSVLPSVLLRILRWSPLYSPAMLPRGHVNRQIGNSQKMNRPPWC